MFLLYCIIYNKLHNAYFNLENELIFSCFTTHVGRIKPLNLKVDSTN